MSNRRYTSQREYIRERFTPPEPVDPVPMEAPVGSGRPTPMRELIQQYVREELGKQAAEDVPPFEEEDDFEAEDPEGDILSGYQVLLMDPEELGLVETLDGTEKDPQGPQNPAGSESEGDAGAVAATGAVPADSTPAEPSSPAAAPNEG